MKDPWEQGFVEIMNSGSDTCEHDWESKRSKRIGNYTYWRCKKCKRFARVLFDDDDDDD